MNEHDKGKLAGEIAAELFGEDYHCAEAVAAGCLQALGHDPDSTVPMATAFGGGFGRTFTETCGVLSGCMLVIGHCHGRRKKGENWDLPAGLGEQLVQEFRDTQGTCNCGVLRERFGEEQMEKCRELVRDYSSRVVQLTLAPSPPQSDAG